MVRNYKKKTNKGHFKEQDMLAAVAAVKKGVSMKRAAREAGVNRTTLLRYVKKAHTLNEGVQLQVNPKPGKHCVFTASEEDNLSCFIKKSARLFHGLSVERTRQLAFNYAVSLKKQIPESWEANGQAGYDWYSGFRKRHPTISLRKPEATSLARAMGFNKEAVAKFLTTWITSGKSMNFCLPNLQFGRDRNNDSPNPVESPGY